MQKVFLIIGLLCLSTHMLYAQIGDKETRYESRFDSIKNTTVDSLYLEDQFYLGFGFNLITDRPTSFNQTGFSGHFNIGYIRDIPINKQRNLGFGIGLGWSVNSYSQNLFIGETSEPETTIFEVINRSDLNVETNRLNTYLIEAPIEFRWRTSSPTEYKFWRIYTGLRLGYVYHYKSNFKQPNNQVSQTDIPELNKFRLGTTFTFGYNTFNFSFYYALNPLFDGQTRDSNEEVGFTPLKIGLMFYIL